MKSYEVMELKDLSSDYAMAEGHIIKVLKENIVPKAMISETRLVFEALCYNVFEQRTNPKDPIKVSAFRRLGYLAIEVTFGGARFNPEPQDPSFLTPEDRILMAYADKIDYSYRSGLNKIMITTRRSQLISAGLYAAGICLGAAVYALLCMTTPAETQQLVSNKIILPVEQVFINAALMVGGPLTFMSIVKHLTNTYIVAESRSNARRLHMSTLHSSLISVLLAIIIGWIVTSLLFSSGAGNGKGNGGIINLDPEQLIPSLIPSDVITPFQSLMPYSLIILAILTTYAFCSVGKHFDRVMDAVDTAYVLFERMLTIVMFFLPYFAALSIMDVLLRGGLPALLSLAEMCAIAFVSLSILLVYYILRLSKSGIRSLPFLRKMIPLLRENALISSVFTAAPYNIRYCIKTYGFDRDRLERTLPVLAQINLDGNCFIITMIAIMYVSIAGTPLSMVDTVAVGIIVLFLSLGAPNQPGSCLVTLAIIMIFLKMTDLLTIAIIAEVVFGGILNLTNVAGDIVTAAIEEVHECGNADQLNQRLLAKPKTKR